MTDITNHHDEVTIILEKIFVNVNEWLKFAEAKNGIVIGLNLATLGTLNSIKSIDNIKILFLIIACICLAAFFNLISFLPLFDTTEVTNKIERDANLLFYKDIAGYYYKDYIKKVYATYCGVEINCKQIQKINVDYAQEICSNARIAVKKYVWCNRALILDIFSLIVIIAVFISNCL